MIFLKGHGAEAGGDGRMSSADACGFSGAESNYGAPAYARFGYYFRDAAETPDAPDLTAKLDRIGDAMVETPPSPDGHSTTPPIFTYLGQFIDHDVTAGTDGDEGISVIDVDRVAPADRADVESAMENMRFGSLQLDSLYGGAPAQGDWARRLKEVLRFPGDPALLWIGSASPVEVDGEVQLVEPPRDPARDLLRLGRLLESDGPLTVAELRALPENLRRLYLDENGDPINGRAIIGDRRNDENLAVAQLHLAFARLHNRIAVTADGFEGDVNDRRAVFEWARKRVVWIYQWLVLKEYLPTVCDPAIVAEVIEDGAPLYSAFHQHHGQAGTDLLPMPLEFSVAAFRFGHSMARHEYDWSARFGRPEAGVTNFAGTATFADLFRFTGDGIVGAIGKLPSNWPIDWRRFAFPPPEDMPDRAARPIDTLLALPLSVMSNNAPGHSGVMNALAKRNLRRGHRLNIPSGQACIQALRDLHGVEIEPLNAEELLSGPDGQAVLDAGLAEATPLWFYVLKEAAARGDGGRRLGPLGSRLVAETLVGLVQKDPNSYWAEQGSDRGGRWWPEDGPKPEGEAIVDLPAMLRAAKVLD